MVGFLTPEWVAALNDALGAVRLDPAVSLTVAHVVRDARGEVVYRLRVHGGRAVASLGDADGADVVLIEDRATAAALAQGRETAEDAVAAGRLKLRGDVDAMLRAAGALGALGEALAEVRGRTVY